MTLPSREQFKSCSLITEAHVVMLLMMKMMMVVSLQKLKDASWLISIYDLYLLLVVKFGTWKHTKQIALHAMCVPFSTLIFELCYLNKWLNFVYIFLSGALQSPRKPLAHRISHGNQKKAPRLRGLSGHDLLCGRSRRHHRAEQRRAIQPQDQPVVSCSSHDIQTEWGECVLESHESHDAYAIECVSMPILSDVFCKATG